MGGLKMADTPEKPKTQDAPLDDKTKTPGDGTLQDATPAGMTSDELRKRAENDEDSVQPGTG